MPSRIEKQLDFLKEIDQLKYIERRIGLPKKGRLENDAEHSWHLAMFIILFAKEFPHIDILKALKLALSHDLVEIYAGDVYTFDFEAKKKKKDKEDKAAKKLFGKLPHDQKKEFMDLYKEYEACKTKESELVNSFDKIQPIIQNIIVKGKNWQRQKISFKDVDGLKRKYMEHDKKIVQIYNQLMGEVKEKKLTYEKNRL